jgi:hypothetical protein
VALFTFATIGHSNYGRPHSEFSKLEKMNETTMRQIKR